MKKIPLTQGKFAIVDDEDFDFLNRFSWQANGGVDNCAVATSFKLQSGRWVSIPMNRFLYKPKIQYHVIYKNKNPLDNRKENIGLVTTAEFNGTSGKMYLNTARRGKMKRNPSSQYKGVSKITDPRYKIKTWLACIQFQGKHYTKIFEKEIEAAKWYNEKALEFFGPTSYQNEINEQPN